MGEVRRISHSELKDFQRCKRRWWLRHVRRLAPKIVGPVGALQSGTRVHEALQAYYTPATHDQVRGIFEARVKQDRATYLTECGKLDIEPDPHVLEQYRKDTDTERAMIEGYTDWLAETGADAHLTIIEAEAVMTVTHEQLGASFMQPFNVVGKLDARAYDHIAQARRFVDHKTAQSLTAILPTLRLDSQMLHYHLLEMLAGLADDERCDGAIYNMLRKVKRTKAAKPPFYAREFVPHNDDEIENYRQRLLGLIVNVFELEYRLAELGDKGVRMFAQPTVTRDCTWDCEFFKICGMFDDGSRVEDAIREMYAERDPLARYRPDAVE